MRSKKPRTIYCDICGSKQQWMHRVGCIIIESQYFIDTGKRSLKYVERGDYKRKGEP